MTGEARRFTDEEAAAVLKRALEKHAQRAEGLSRDELLAAAREVGVTPEALDAAIAEHGARARDEALRARWSQRARGVAGTLWVVALAVGAALVAVNALVSPAVPWSAAPLAALFVAAVVVTARWLRGPSEQALERQRLRDARAAERRAWAEKHEAELAARRERHEALARDAKELEVTLTKSVGQILQGVTRVLEQSTQAPRVRVDVEAPEAPGARPDEHAVQQPAQHADARREGDGRA